MRKIVWVLLALLALPSYGQRTLTLDSCRAMALRNNKHLVATRINKEVAYNTRRSARTNYLPKVDAIGSYQYMSKEISLLNKSQKAFFSSLGSSSTSEVSNLLTNLAQSGAISPELAQQLGGMLSQVAGPLETAGNTIGQKIRDAFKTDTKNFWTGYVMVRKAVYMGGVIIVVDKVADMREQMGASREDLSSG